MKFGWTIVVLGLGVAATPVLWGRSLQAPLSFALSMSSDRLIAEDTAIERCDAVIRLATRAGQIPQVDATADGPGAPVGSARVVRVMFPARNARGVELEYAGWCRVWYDGHTAIVRLIETEGRDLLASSQTPAIRDAYLERVKISKMDIGAEGFSGVITNRNDFSINNTEVSCRFSNNAVNSEGSIMRLERVIPPGGSTKVLVQKPAGAQAVGCRVVDFARVSPAEQRLIDVFGATGAQASLARLRQDAIRVNVPIEVLVEPYIKLTKALASARH